MLYLTNDEARIEAAINKLHKLLKGKGFSYKRSIQSAMFMRVYKLGDIEVCVNGWHGTGQGNRNYGDGMTVHDVYVTKRPGMYGKALVNPGESVVGAHPVVYLYEHLRSGKCLWISEEAREAALKDIDGMADAVSKELERLK